LTKGFLVALRETNTFTGLINGDSFGASVDYSMDTNSHVVGILAGGRSDHNYWSHDAWGQAQVRGPTASLHHSGTCTAGDMLFTHNGLDGSTYCTNTNTGLYYRPESFVGICISPNGTNATATIAAFINTYWG
jgi:hypothetical protein